jgi:hypothetical protein
MMGDVPPVTLAAWRLQLTTVILACGACWQWPRMCTADKVRARQDWLWSCAGGVSLALHFACWVFSLQHTSITHAAVLVCLSPVLLVALTLLRRKPISGGEIGGSVLALAGEEGYVMVASTGHLGQRAEACRATHVLLGCQTSTMFFTCLHLDAQHRQRKGFQPHLWGMDHSHDRPSPPASVLHGVSC